ncbi:hypothetical protein HanRHA438_Chr17g0799931 [Helianthus annuus]|nr:hypothetical protein HanRHA438_Chr17g0799931 [Helianthus annuus]
MQPSINHCLQFLHFKLFLKKNYYIHTQKKKKKKNFQPKQLTQIFRLKPDPYETQKSNELS